MTLALTELSQATSPTGVALPALGVQALLTSALVGVSAAGIAYMGSKPATRARNARWSAIVAGGLAGVLLIVGGAKALAAD